MEVGEVWDKPKHLKQPSTFFKSKYKKPLQKKLSSHHKIQHKTKKRGHKSSLKSLKTLFISILPLKYDVFSSTFYQVCSYQL